MNGTVHGVEALKNGDILAASRAFMDVGLAAVGGVTSCQRASKSAMAAQRAFHGASAGVAVMSAAGKFAQGDWFGGFVDLADAGANLYMMGCASPRARRMALMFAEGGSIGLFMTPPIQKRSGSQIGSRCHSSASLWRTCAATDRSRSSGMHSRYLPDTLSSTWHMPPSDLVRASSAGRD